MKKSIVGAGLLIAGAITVSAERIAGLVLVAAPGFVSVLFYLAGGAAIIAGLILSVWGLNSSHHGSRHEY